MRRMLWWLRKGEKEPRSVEDRPIPPPEELKPYAEREADFMAEWAKAMRNGVVDVRELRKKHHLDRG